MDFVVIFDFLRHLVELFFYAIAGPFIAWLSYKKVVNAKSEELRLIELQKSLLNLAVNNPEVFKENIAPLISGSKGTVTLPEGKQ